MIPVKTLKLKNAAYVNHKIESTLDDVHHEVLASEDFLIYLIRARKKPGSPVTIVTSTNVDYVVLDDEHGAHFHKLLDEASSAPNQPPKPLISRVNARPPEDSEDQVPRRKQKPAR